MEDRLQPLARRFRELCGRVEREEESADEISDAATSLSGILI
jgi:hypothetical protein